MELTTTRQVIDRLGGPSAVAELTGRGKAAVSNWASWDHFPCNTADLLRAELAKRNLVASPKLWRMVRRT